MLKATLKGRVTTLSKTLLTAGLLGAAALTTLGAGSAKAEKGRFDCSFGASVVHPKCSNVFFDSSGNPTAGVKLGDKTLTKLVFSPENPPSGDFSFLWLLQDMYATEASFDPTLPPPSTGSYTYDLVINDPSYIFKDVELDVDHFGTGVEVTKKVTGIPDLVSINGAPVGPEPLSGTSITVTDSWKIIEGSGGILSISNTYTQVPAPLPLLGVGAVFGSIRKLRKFSSQLKTFSMA